MDGEHVIYDGREVPKEHFRAFVYGFHGARLLAKSWLEYEARVSSGIWFPKLEDVPELASEETKPEVPTKDIKSKGRKKDGA